MINMHMNGKQLCISLLEVSDCKQLVPQSSYYPFPLTLEHHYSLYHVTSPIIPLLEHALNGTHGDPFERNFNGGFTPIM